MNKDQKLKDLLKEILESTETIISEELRVQIKPLLVKEVSADMVVCVLTICPECDQEVDVFDQLNTADVFGKKSAFDAKIKCPDCEGSFIIKEINYPD